MYAIRSYYVMQEHSTTLGINNNLFTIIHEPESISDLKTAIVFINAGIIHRIGPNRIYVEQARLLASRGYLVVRFDISGIGDSNSINENNDLVESGICDTIEVIDYIKTKYNIHNVGLIGICSGADIAFEVSKIKKDVKSSLFVITSYSIHYTKLYETFSISFIKLFLKNIPLINNELFTSYNFV